MYIAKIEDNKIIFKYKIDINIKRGVYNSSFTYI